MSQLVSVILPTYNRRSLLPRAIQSVLAQTHRELELIIVDDGSTDGTDELVQRYAAGDRRLRYLAMPKRGGPAAARNTGIRAAQGSWIAFQDSDDEWRPSKLEKQLRAVNSSDTGLVCCGYQLSHFDEPLRDLRPNDSMRTAPRMPLEVLYGLPFIAPTWLVRREVFAQLGGFDETLPNLEDWEFTFRVYPHFGFGFVDEALVVKYSSHDSHDANPAARLISFEQILAKHGALWKESPPVLAQHWEEIGRLRLRLGNVAGARNAFWRAWRLRPMRLKTLLRTLASLPLLRSLASFWKRFRHGG
ncbi:MAG: glycosyltransferase family 2 protein [Nevskiales bacterium]